MHKLFVALGALAFVIGASGVAMAQKKPATHHVSHTKHHKAHLSHRRGGYN